MVADLGQKGVVVGRLFHSSERVELRKFVQRLVKACIRMEEAKASFVLSAFERLFVEEDQ